MSIQDHPAFRDMPNVRKLFASGDLFVVICPDNARRHVEAFASKAEAKHFAEWGHCCLAGNQHTIIAVPVDPFEGIAS